MKKIFVKVFTIIGWISAYMIKRLYSRKLSSEEEQTDIILSSYLLIIEWLKLKQSGISLADYFIDNKYEKIAMYGAGKLGHRLYDELKDTKIKIEYGIDSNKDARCNNLRMVRSDDDFDTVDAIVVTPFVEFAEISTILRKKYHGNIVSLDEIIYSINRKGI